MAEQSYIDEWVPDGSTVSGSSDTSDTILDGELQLLRSSLEDDAVTPLPPMVIKKSLSGTLIDDSGMPVYGMPLSKEEAASRVPPGNGGLGWNITIIPDDYFVNGKLRSGLNRRDFDTVHQKLKPRRPSLPVTAKDFFSSLIKVDGPDGVPRFIFHGLLNGWPSLRYFELISLEQRRDVRTLPNAKDLFTGHIMWSTIWDTKKAKGQEPKVSDNTRVYRAKLRGAPWSSIGWSKESPGFAFWFEARRPQGPRLSYGSDMVKTVDDARCSYIHMLSHRYAKERESPRDKLTYHSVCLLEWEHGEYCTVVETAFLNGMGGYKGRSNWYDDKDDEVTALYQALPPEMICPWRSTSAEVRCYDVEAKTLAEFKDFVAKYTGCTKRFVDPHFTHSHAARLTFRTKSHIAQYLVNYISRDSSYAELKRNCQTFTADLFSFIAGKKGIAPFHPVNRIEYTNRTYLFLYDSHMYERKIDKK